MEFDEFLDLKGIVNLIIEPINNSTANYSKDGLIKKTVVNDTYSKK
jgi:hypothetical protein